MTGNKGNDQELGQRPARHRRDKGVQRRRVLIADGTYTGGTLVHTGQFFFDADLNEEVQATSPYSDNTTAETALGDDPIYDDGGAASGLLTLTALGSDVSDGYTATLTVGVSTS
ncbi:hypothetical protein [Streptomyces sp. Agncl-13]|uniref:hypothetical protein n=1 Tax=Streptomyces sp. Agncl-13 TaxID=3400628 RepID=UPI003A8621A8